jgi:hypothetical protein
MTETITIMEKFSPMVDIRMQDHIIKDSSGTISMGMRHGGEAEEAVEGATKIETVVVEDMETITLSVLAEEVVC